MTGSIPLSAPIGLQIESSPSTAIAPRYRSKTGMRWLDTTLSPQTLFPAAEARHDKLEVSIELSFDVRSVEAFQEVAEIWGDQSESPLFNVTDGKGNSETSKKLKIARGWHISGTGNAYLNRQTLRGTIFLSLSVNPTRFYAHQTQTTIDAIQNVHATNTMRKSQSVTKLEGLDGGDNLLDMIKMGGTSFEGREAHWDRLIHVYFEDIEELLTRHLAPSPLGVVPADLLTRFTVIRITTISYAEVHWELSVADAPSLMNQIRSSVGCVAPSFGQTHPGRYSEGAEKNCAWVKLSLLADCSLLIYAKALNRIRFEVSYTGHLPVKGYDLPAPSHLSQSEICRKLRRISYDAAKRLQGSWLSVRRNLHQTDDIGNIPDFMRRLRRANAGTFEDVLISLLSSTGRIAQENFPERVLERLVKEGILIEPVPVRARGGKVYPLAQPWVNMFRATSGSGRT